MSRSDEDILKDIRAGATAGSDQVLASTLSNVDRVLELAALMEDCKKARDRLVADGLNVQVASSSLVGMLVAHLWPDE